MRNTLTWASLALTIFLSGCAQQAVPLPPAQPAGMPAVLTGGRVWLKLDSSNADLAKRLQFRVFENGADDLIYVGVTYGMWSRGEFDLSFRGKVIYTGKVPHLLYSGALINMGDVVPGDPDDGLSITRVGGWFK